MRSTPVWHIDGEPALSLAVWQLVPAGAPARSLPDTTTITGASRASMRPSQFESCTRPTTGVDQTSVKSGMSFATGPHVHRAAALSGPVGGWYSHCARQPPSSAPASAAQTGGSVRHLPPGGIG